MVEFNSGLLHRGDDEFAEVEAELVGFYSFILILHAICTQLLSDLTLGCHQDADLKAKAGATKQSSKVIPVV